MVENAFGILAARCYVLRGPILQSYPNAVKTIKACTVFHNFLLTKDPVPRISEEEDGAITSALSDLQAAGPVARGTHHGRLLREKLADFFMNDGQVDFQWSKAFATSK